MHCNPYSFVNNAIDHEKGIKCFARHSCDVIERVDIINTNGGYKEASTSINRDLSDYALHASQFSPPPCYLPN